MTSARRLPLLALAGLVLVLALGGCTTIKPGSVALTQPAGIGPLNLRLTLCTTAASEVPAAVCLPAPSNVQGQMLAGLIVPSGTTAPATIVAAPGPGATPTTFTRSQEVGAAFSAAATPPGSVPPPGFEIVGYISGVVGEVEGQTAEWALSAELRQPVSVDGGSYGLPFTTAVRSGWREVTPAFPATRPVVCLTPADLEAESPIPPERAICDLSTGAGNEVTLGISDLKLKAPVPTVVAPGAKVKVPFVLDFASSANPLPQFTLTASSKLPGAKVSVSNSSFSRGPSNPANNRAPATTRQAIVEVPASARLGSYELGFTATAAQGGLVAATTQLVVKPNGKTGVVVPKKVKASVASSKGIPVTLLASIAGTRFQVVLKGPARLLKKTREAKAAGRIELRLRLGKPKAEALLAAGAKLKLEVKVNQPGTKRPLRLVRALKLR